MSEWIDITRTLSKGMVQWPGDRPFDCRRIVGPIGPDPCNVSTIDTCVHVGTHIETPLHFIKDGMDIADVPLAKLCGPAVVVDIPEARDIEMEDLQKAGIEPGLRVLMKTANAKLWDKPQFDSNYHSMSVEAAMWLVDHEVPLVGIDYLSVDRYENDDSPVHRALLENGVIIIEGLDLSHVGPGLYEMAGLPLKLAGSEAAPARVIIRETGR